MRGHYYKPKCTCEGRCKCNATWSYIIDIGRDPKTGKRKQKKKGGFKTKKQAQDAAAKLMVELQNGTYYKESSILFEDFSLDWLNLYKDTGRVKDSTVRARKHERTRLLDYFAKLKLKEISAKKYQDALYDLLKRGYALNTINGVHGTGRMIFKKARELELIKKDPTEFAIVPKPKISIEEIEIESELPKFLEKRELKVFLKTAKNFGMDQDYVIFMLLAYTGIRVGELCALKWSDIDFDKQTISVTKTYYNPKNNTKEFYLQTPKTRASKRIIDTDDTIINLLKKHKAFQNKILMNKRDTYYNGNFLFTSIKKYPGYPFYIKKVQNRMKRILKLSNLNTNLTPHSLRHTHTSLLAEAGVNLDLIMDRLGHEDEKTTRRVYMHVTENMKKEASIKFSTLMKDL